MNFRNYENLDTKSRSRSSSHGSSWRLASLQNDQIERLNELRIGGYEAEYIANSSSNLGLF